MCPSLNWLPTVGQEWKSWAIAFLTRALSRTEVPLQTSLPLKADPQTPSHLRVLLTSHEAGKLLYNRARDILEASEAEMQRDSRIQSVKAQLTSAIELVRTMDRSRIAPAFQQFLTSLAELKSSTQPALKKAGQDIEMSLSQRFEVAVLEPPPFQAQAFLHVLPSPHRTKAQGACQCPSHLRLKCPST